MGRFSTFHSMAILSNLRPFDERDLRMGITSAMSLLTVTNSNLHKCKKGDQFSIRALFKLIEITCYLKSRKLRAISRRVSRFETKEDTSEITPPK